MQRVVAVHQKTKVLVAALLQEILDCLNSAFDFAVSLGVVW